MPTLTPAPFLLLAAALAGSACAAPETSATRPSPHPTVAPADASAAPDVAAPPGDAPVPGDVAPPPPPSTCASGRRWMRGDDGDREMNPGQACVSCHRREGDEDFPRQLAGTAYAADNQVDNCYGFAGDRSTRPSNARVEVVDGAGRALVLPVNESGNFFYEDWRGPALVFPLRSVAVIGPSGTRNAMGFGPPHGDCNACHTQAGTTTVAGGDPAPGRVLVLP